MKQLPYEYSETLNAFNFLLQVESVIGVDDDGRTEPNHPCAAVVEDYHFNKVYDSNGVTDLPYLQTVSHMKNLSFAGKTIGR